MYGYFCIGFMKFVLRSKRRNIDNTPLKWQGFSIWKKKIFWREHYNCPKKLDEKKNKPHKTKIFQKQRIQFGN